MNATETTPVGSAFRRARVVVIVAVLLHLVTRGADSGQVTVELAVVAGLLLVNVISLAEPVAPRRLAWALRAHEVALDAVLTLFSAASFGFLESELSWVVLAVPVLEGALRFRMVGAVTTWVGVTAAYFAYSFATTSGGRFSEAGLETALDRMALLLLVVAPVGFLADQLLDAVHLHRDAHAEADRRNRLLQVVAERTHEINALGNDMAKTVADTILDLGLDASDVWEREGRDGPWRCRATRRRAGAPRLPRLDPDSAPVIIALEHETAVVCDDTDPGDDERKLLRDGAFRAAVVAVTCGKSTVVVVRGAVRAGAGLTATQVECIDLLVRQVTVAADNRELVRTLQSAHESLEHQAHHDSLTGLPNRAGFQRCLDEMFSAPSRGTLALLFLDLDRFKEINDSFGHGAGDQLLTAVAARIRSTLRKGAETSRLGGDEFVILAHVRSQAEAEQIAARVLHDLGAPFSADGNRVLASASIGIALADASVRRSEELLRRADVAMYIAKRAGKGRVEVYRRDLETASATLLALEADLREAVTEGGLRVVFQPVSRISTGRLVGAEALVRWDHPEHGPISPGDFIPLAEQSDLVSDIDRFVLREACREATTWAPRGGPRPWLSVNTSPRELTRSDFVGHLQDAISETGLPPSRLILEVTERAIGDVCSWEHLERARELGVRVSIDDFGAGQTSLQHLRELPLQFLKIDKSFVDGLSEGSANPEKAILKSVIELARDLGMASIAEGVENAGQLDMLRSLRCDAAQGFHVAKPMPPDDVRLRMAAARRVRSARPTTGSPTPRRRTRRVDGAQVATARGRQR